MKTNGKFVAQILETSAAGYAGLTASLLFERDPEIAKRYEPNAFAAWKDQLRQWLLDLSAAIAAGEPKLFEARALWTRDSFVARQVAVEDLQAALASLRDILRERLPEDAADTVVAVMDRASDAVAGSEGGQAAHVGAVKLGKPALAYLEKILEGKPREAIESLLSEVEGGMSVKDAYLQVLLPAQREVGRMWHAGELVIAEEHAVTATTQHAMALLCERGRTSARLDKTALLGCVAGDVHDMGIRAVADFFEMAGWRTISLGPDVPCEEIARSVQLFDADILLLSATLPPHLKAVQQAIERVRSFEESNVKIILGGAVFKDMPDLWRKIDADGYAAKLEDAEPLASRLTRA